MEAAEVFHRLEPLLLQFGDVVLVIEAFQNFLVTCLGRSVDPLEIGAQQIADTHAVAAHLVRIGRADALARGADLGAALGRLVGRVEDAVRRQDQVGFLRNAELAGQVVAAGRQRLGLLTEKDGVDHHPVADDVGLAALENARRYRAEYVLLAVEFQRVTGIGTALEPGHHLVAGRQHVHDLPFALVTPLQAEDHVNFFHCIRYLIYTCKRHFLHPKVQIIIRKAQTARRTFQQIIKKTGRKEER